VLASAGAGVVSAADAPESDAELERVLAAEAGRIDVMAMAARSVVCIFGKGEAGAGAGVIISDDGVGLTNFHVVMGMLGAGGAYGGLSDGRRYPLEVLGVDPTGDVAMFRLSGREKFDAAPLGESARLQVGERVFAMGNPFALAEDYTPTATFGIVSGLHRYQAGENKRSLVYTDCIQIDASINPGNSGGPLFDMAGRLIGINGRASFERRGRVNVGLAYAISIEQIRRFMPGMRAGLLVEHGTLGATFTDGEPGRVVLNRMLPDSPAERAGLQPGDRLVRFAGHDIRTANDFGSHLGAYPAGWPVEVIFERDGQTSARTVHLDRLPVNAEMPFERDESVTREAAKQLAAAEHDEAAEERPPVPPPVEAALRRTAKIYGGAIGDERGYGTGIIVSGDGLVVTPLSIMLEATSLRVVTHDGRVRPARVKYRDRYRQLALLECGRNDETAEERSGEDDAASTVWEAFPLEDEATLQSGDWVLVVGNPFKVAEGPETLTVMMGVCAGRTRLDATDGAQAYPYRGDVLLLDAITSNPGSSGSAVIDLDGHLVGMAGESVTLRATHTDAHFAYPVEELRRFLEEARDAGTDRPRADRTADAKPGYHGIRLSQIGYRRRLPFVRSVAAGSPAAEAGLRTDDLVVSANGTPIAQARDFETLCRTLRPDDTLTLVVKRGEELLTIRLTLTETPE
jgi:S1-C subfamily serine protease